MIASTAWSAERHRPFTCQGSFVGPFDRFPLLHQLKPARKLRHHYRRLQLQHQQQAKRIQCADRVSVPHVWNSRKIPTAHHSRLYAAVYHEVAYALEGIESTVDQAICIHAALQSLHQFLRTKCALSAVISPYTSGQRTSLHIGLLYGHRRFDVDRLCNDG